MTAPQTPKASGPKPAPEPENVQRRNFGPVRPPVKQTFRRMRHAAVFISFMLCVVMPGAGTAIYMWVIADDQYASKVGFTVRREEANSAVEFLGGLGNLSGASSSDTDILYEFIQSQKLVADLDREVDLRAIWSRPAYDPVFALDEDASIEELVDYWNSMVQLSYGAGSGLLEIEVRAFHPDDALRITQTLFDESSQMINDLSDIAREDAIGYAQDELDTALERLKQARETITRFRNENQIINPDTDMQSQAGLLNTLQTQLAEALIENDLLSATTQLGDPRLDQVQRRIDVIRNRIAEERQKLGVVGPVGGNQALADIVGEFERLVVDREFAESAYVSSLATYDAALAEARRKSRYLAAYMEPTRAETSVYPRRLVLTGLITLFLFLVWSIVVLVGYSLKDRR